VRLVIGGLIVYFWNWKHIVFHGTTHHLEIWCDRDLLYHFPGLRWHWSYYQKATS